jgi:hypothetical protein
MKAERMTFIELHKLATWLEKNRKRLSSEHATVAVAASQAAAELEQRVTEKAMRAFLIRYPSMRWKPKIIKRPAHSTKHEAPMSEDAVLTLLGELTDRVVRLEHLVTTPRVA